MAKSKLEQLKVLSPLAAAIAFSAALPSHALAAKFVITSQSDLNNAVGDINEDAEGSHTITFDSSLSGQSLNLKPMQILYQGSLVIDGAGAEDLDLVVLNGSNTSGIQLSGGGEGAASLTIKNVNVVEGANAEQGLVIKAYGDAHITIENSHFSGASKTSNEGEGVIEAEGITIRDSSFSGLSGENIIRVYDVGGYSDESQKVSITNTTFSNNYSNEHVLEVAVHRYGTEMTRLDIGGVSFDGNKTGDSVVKIVAYAYYGDDQTIDATIVNTSFTNNKSEDGIIEIDARTYWNSSSDATINLNLANITIANNIIDGSAFDLYASDYTEGEGIGETTASINMAHATIVNNGGVEGSERFYGGYGFRVRSYGYDPEVNIVNSIISGNTRINEGKIKGRLEEISESELELVDADLYSSFEISVDNTLIGAEPEGEGSVSGKNNLVGVDPMLGELTMDTQTGTMYLSPASDSPAIDAGTDKYAADIAKILDVKVDELIDQLGNRREVGSAPDMGAIETGNESSGSSGIFGSLGLGSILASLGLVVVRRKRK